MDWVDELVWAATKWKGERWIREKIAKFAIQAFKGILLQMLKAIPKI